MLSCEGSSFVFAGAPRLHMKTSSPTGTKAVKFGGPTCVAPLSFARSEVCGHGGSGKTVVGASYSSMPLRGMGGSESYTRSYAQDDASVGVIAVATTITEGAENNSGAADGVVVDGGDADDEPRERATSSNEVPTPEMTTDEEEGRPHNANDDDDPQQQQQQQQLMGMRMVLQQQQQQQHDNEEEGDGEEQRSTSLHHRPLDRESDATSSCKMMVQDAQCDDAVAPGGSAEGCVSSASTSVSSSNGNSKIGKTFNSWIDVTTARMAVTLFLENLCEDNKAEPVLTSDFHSHRLPPMSVDSYVDRITRYSHVSGETLIVSLLLLLKYSHFVGHPVSIYNVHRLMITSVLLGAKMRDDVYYSNEYYSRIGGISNAEINKLEVRFCTQLEWDMWIDEQEYEMFEALLLRLMDKTTSAAENVDEAKLKEIQRHFWFEHLQPWKCFYEKSTSLRRERMRRNIEEDQSSECEKSRLHTPQSIFPVQYPIGPYGNSRFVREDQLILPAVFGRPTCSLTNNNHNHVTVVTVPSTSTSGSLGMQQQQQQQRGGFDENSEKFGISQRAVVPPATTSIVFSDISVHAKPYYYKSSRSSASAYAASQHQQHRHLSGQNGTIACGTTPITNDVNTGNNNYTESTSNGKSSGSGSGSGSGGALTNITTWRASGHNPHHQNNNNNSNKRMVTSACDKMLWEPSNSNGSARNCGPLAVPSHPQQSSGVASEQPGAAAGGGKRGGKKRPKPDHYQDYR